MSLLETGREDEEGNGVMQLQAEEHPERPGVGRGRNPFKMSVCVRESECISVCVRPRSKLLYSGQIYNPDSLNNC